MESNIIFNDAWINNNFNSLSILRNTSSNWIIFRYTTSNGDIYEILFRSNNTSGKIVMQYKTADSSQFVQQWYIN